MCFMCERSDMSSERWVRRFSVDETRKHAAGFTIYKITSVLFTLSCPEAGTVVCVWKRYRDVCALHKSIVTLHAALHLTGKPPALPKPAYFNRFNDAVISERAQTIKQLLDLIAEHQLLFTSAEFVNFLQSGYDIEEANTEPPTHEYAPSLPPPALTPVKLYECEGDPEQTAAMQPATTTSVAEGTEVASTSPGHLASNGTNHDTGGDTEMDGVERDEESLFRFYTNTVQQLLQLIHEETDLEKIKELKKSTDKYLTLAENIYGNKLEKERSATQDVRDAGCIVERDLSELSHYRLVKVETDRLCLLSLDNATCHTLEVLDKVWCGDRLLRPILVGPCAFVCRARVCVDATHALFVVCEHASGGGLMNYLDRVRRTGRTMMHSEPPDRGKDLSVEELVMNSQKLIQDVDTTLYNTRERQSIDCDVGETACDGGERQSMDCGAGEREMAIPPATIRKWAAQILIAVEQLHAQAVILRELHSTSVLMSECGVMLRYPRCYPTGAVTLAALCAAHAHAHAHAHADTCHVAPEIHERPAAEPHPACDWWSYGALLYLLICGVPLSSEHWSRFYSHTVLQFPVKLTLEEECLLTQLLTYEVEERLGYNGAEEIKQHPYFRGVDFAALKAEWDARHSRMTE